MMKHLLIVSAASLTSCFNKEKKMIYEVKSKDTNQKAILAISSAEWNVGDAYHVYILSEDESIEGNDYGIVFTANEWDNVLPRDSSKIKLKWLHGDTLMVSFNRKLRIYNQVIRTRDNIIVYDDIARFKKGNK
jgi:hypothetical protein